jgi:hypothetical protein
MRKNILDFLLLAKRRAGGNRCEGNPDSRPIFRNCGERRNGHGNHMDVTLDMT